MRALFLGSKSLGLNIFRCLHESETNVEWKIVHPVDVADTRSASESFNQYAKEQNIDIFMASSAKEAKKIVIDFSPDVVFVSGWYWLIDDQTLSCSALGFYGIHNSLLPKYRGGSPLVWSIINGDSEVGATAFSFASGMDDGRILHQVRVSNTQKDDIGTILKKIETALVDTLPDTWRSLLNGTAQFTEQDHSLATFCGQRMPEDGKIDWAMSSMQVHNFIRAQTPPYPGAFDYLGERKIVFLRTEVEETLYFGTPGQILRRFSDNVLISCGGNSAINVLEVAVDGVPTRPSKALPSISIRLR
jgi:methionyl-tRNA formyltransferase